MGIALSEQIHATSVHREYRCHEAMQQARTHAHTRALHQYVDVQISTPTHMQSHTHAAPGLFEAPITVRKD